MLRRTSLLWRAVVDRITLVGVVRDGQLGSVNDETCFQFNLVTHSLDPTAQPAEGREALPLAKRKEGTLKQQFVVRCTGAGISDELWASLRLLLGEGCVVRLVGQLRVNMQIDGGRRLPFPFVALDLRDAKSSLRPISNGGQMIGGDAVARLLSATVKK